jgi:phage shock protein C
MGMGSYRWPGFPAGLYRDPENGRVAGVCAGLGQYFQIRPKFIRVGIILGCIFGLFLPILIGYGLLTLMLPVVSEMRADDLRWSSAGQPDSEHSQGAAAGNWESRIDGLMDRFRGLDRRLADVEAKVTSEEFRLRQQFRDL